MGGRKVTSPAIINGTRQNEWFPYVKVEPLRLDTWSLSLLGGYNTQAESLDGEWSSPLIGPGEAYTMRLTDPGEYSYYCTVHPFMRGVIIVEVDRSSPEDGR